jgi:hypothetical protein
VCAFWLVSRILFIYSLLFSSFFREARENAEVAKHRAERPKIQQQFADLKRGLSVVTDEEWENIPEVGNLTRKKRRRDERSFVVPDSVIVGDRSKTEYENSLDNRQQQVSLFILFLVGVSECRADRRIRDTGRIWYVDELCRDRSGSRQDPLPQA